MRAIPHRMERCGYVSVRNEDRTDGFWLIGGRRQVIYAKKELSFRDQYAAAQKLVTVEEKLEKEAAEALEALERRSAALRARST